ncbi:hypothetical protein CAL20_24005 [Bordetella genomosp. 4]|uniref:Uncharacterized protein n=1 Tax=Bordetella genomosp. 4 TaxID=463044 RepID=A0A261TMJ7_9BORD|nr:hypothetical protein CAL21_21475 [Bordetella genomosp. 4]OZI50886.1 hypothetical protein CAL20_24005 [Bordetella genomosp. 4]
MPPAPSFFEFLYRVWVYIQYDTQEALIEPYFDYTSDRDEIALVSVAALRFIPIPLPLYTA